MTVRVFFILSSPFTRPDIIVSFTFLDDIIGQLTTVCDDWVSNEWWAMACKFVALNAKSISQSFFDMVGSGLFKVFEVNI